LWPRTFTRGTSKIDGLPVRSPLLASASAIFGAVHLVNFGQDPKEALYAVPTIAVLGGSLGLAYAHTGHKLSTSVAMHFWYDFLLSTVAFAADPRHQPFVVSYGTNL
jgi:hypothetical protein